ncbi:MAG: hypothetical protein QG637_966 [Chloroflexota bacterium]|nr:hypothetical protein [Chloroflexota bacterium]
MNNNRGLWIALAALLLLVCCCCALAWATGSLVTGGIRAGVSAVEQDGGAWQTWLRSLDGDWRNWAGPWTGNLGAPASAAVEQALTVQGPATLDLNVPVGDVIVRAGPVGQVKIEGTKRAYGATQADAERRLDEIEVKVDQSGDKVWVRVSGPVAGGNPGRASQVNLTITVPPQTTIAANMGVGRLQITGTTGDVTANAEVGDVILTDVTPTEKLTVETRIASVHFTGALAPNARYEFTTDVGKVALRLPDASAFNLDARSDIGDVTVGFAVTGRSSRDALVGKEVRGEVGQNPTTSLYLRSRVGEISIKPGR